MQRRTSLTFCATECVEFVNCLLRDLLGESCEHLFAALHRVQARPDAEVVHERVIGRNLRGM